MRKHLAQNVVETLDPKAATHLQWSQHPVCIRFVDRKCDLDYGLRFLKIYRYFQNESE